MIRIVRSPMLVVCPNCGTSYQLKPKTLGEAGRTVRCARCRTSWYAAPAAPEPDPPELDAPDAADWGITRVSGDWVADAAMPAGGEQTRTIVPVSPGGVAIASRQPEIDTPQAIVLATEAPPLVPAIDEPIEASAIDIEPILHPLPEDVESAAARKSPSSRARGQWRQRIGAVPAIIAGLLVLTAGLVAWRTEIVRALPQTAALYSRAGMPVNLRGLAFQDVKTSDESHEGVPVLVIEGTIANIAKSTVEIPRLRFAVHNQTGLEVYAWTALPTQSLLSEGESIPFRTRLASPPADAKNVQVRFFNKSDLESGR